MISVPPRLLPCPLDLSATVVATAVPISVTHCHSPTKPETVGLQSNNYRRNTFFVSVDVVGEEGLEVEKDKEKSRDNFAQLSGWMS